MKSEVYKLKRKLQQYLNRKVLYYLNKGFAFNPTSLFIAINTNCNLNCKMCDSAQNKLEAPFAKNAGTNQEKAILSLELVKKIINEVKDFYPNIGITSREPLLHPNIIDIADYILKNRLQCNLTTNGYLLSKYAEDLVRVGLSGLNISIDGPEEIHDEIRGKKGAFRKATEGIEAVNYFKQRFNRHYPKIRVYYTISDLNHQHLLASAMEFRKLNITKMYFQHLNFITEEMVQIHNQTIDDYHVSTAGGVSANNIDKIDVEALYQQLSEVKHIREIPISVQNFSKSQLEMYYFEPQKFIYPSRRCYSPWLYSQVTAQGEVVPRLRCYPVVFGNIKDSTFKEIWNNEEYWKFRLRLRDKKVFPACSRCWEVTC